MQKRIKTYGKRSTRIITVSTTTVSTSSTNTFPQPTSTNDPDVDVSSTSTQSSDRQSSPPPQPKHIPKIDLMKRKPIPKPKPQPLATLVNMDVASSRLKSKSTKSDGIQYTKHISEPRKDKSRTRGAPIKPQPSTTAASAGTRSKKTSSPPRINASKHSSKQATQSESSDSDSPIQSRAGPRSRPNKYVVTDSSESEIEVQDGSNSEPPSSQSSQSSLRRKKATTKGRAPPSNDDTDASESSSIDSLPQTRNQVAKPSSSALSSDSDVPKPTFRRNQQENAYFGTPQLKASHLRQARYRRPTPFKRIPRISLTSTITTPGPSILGLPLQTSTPAKRRNVVISNQSSSDEEIPIITSSPLTWENTITPQAVRLQALPPQSPGSESDLETLSSEDASRKALAALLEIANQHAPLAFTEFLDTFKARELETISSHGPRNKARTVQRASLKYRKIGDASYSEVFGIGDVVIKIIPLALEIEGSDDEEDEEIDDVPFKSSLESVLKEIVITKTVGDSHDGFIKLLRTYVVNGKYPKVLLREWDEFKRDRGSDGTRPDSFNERQLYSIIVLPHAGVDLETYTFGKTAGSSKQSTGWRDAAEIFWQVARSLASAEERLRFEHRDLHWGQIVVRKSAASEGSEPVIHATIIDLALSRLEEGGNVQFSVFEDELFTGRGIHSHQDSSPDEGLEPDYQFDVYRMMKSHNENDWAPFHPLTNIMWLHYLSLKLLKHKGLRKPNPSTRQSTFNKKTLSTSTIGSHLESELQAYQHLANVERCLEARLEGIVAEVTGVKAGLNRGKGTVKGKGSTAGAKSIMSSQQRLGSMASLDSAADVVLLWLTKEW